MMEEQNPSDDKKNDSKYRRYVAALEKCLQSFESVNEWADVISFLSRLGKVFNSFPTFKEIPFKLNLAKRLAQCLNPALPAGVHQKTLEVYEMVFRKIGNENLVKDLYLYSFGLFPFFEHSATLVKNSLLELYEVYLVPLGPGLTPSLRPLVLSIILGLEEESSDYFTKVNNLLNRIKLAVGTLEFYDAIWTGLLISPHHRLAIVNFLLKNIPTNASDQELMEICVNNTRLVSSALSASLQDHEQLVIRGSLEILLKHFPVEKKFFEIQQLTDLFKSSMNVLTRKDMSLTRRFYTWILTSGSSETENLSDYNQKILIFALQNLINSRCSSPEEFSKPFKLLVFILDKPIVSDPLLKECLFSLVKLTIEASRVLSADDFVKVLNSANLLFRMLELDVIWGAFLREINETDLKNVEKAEKVVQSIAFAFDNLFICDDTSAMIQVHILINYVLRKMFVFNSTELELDVVDAFINLCIKLNKKLSISCIQSANFKQMDEIDQQLCVELSNCLLNGHIDVPTIDNFAVLKLLISSARIITSHVIKIIDFSNHSKVKIGIFTKSSILLLTLMEKSREICDIDLKLDFNFNLWFEKLLSELENCTDVEVIHSFLIQINESTLYWKESHAKVRSSLVERTLPFLWVNFLNESFDKDHICFLITIICRILPNESDIFFAQVLSTSFRNRQFNIIEHFTDFWDFTVTSRFLADVPLRISVLILVDFMTKNEFRFRKCSTSWIFSISKYLDRFLIPAISSFIDILECGMNEASNSALSSKKCFRKNFDKDPLIYYLNIIERLLEVNYDNVLNYLTITEVDQYLMIQMYAFVDLVKKQLNISFDFDFKNNYLNLLIILCLPLIAMEEHKSSKPNSSPARVAALNMLCLLLKGVNCSSLHLVRILIDFSMMKVNNFVCNISDSEKQLHFLKLFTCIISNDCIAQLFSWQDAIYLSEINKKALEITEDPELIHNWSEFTLTLSLLPNSNIEIIMSILIDAFVARLYSCSKSPDIFNPAILSSIFICIAKLSIFYLAAKSNLFSDNHHLRSSVSCLLNEVKNDTTTVLSTVKLSTAINLDDFDKIISGLFIIHQHLLHNRPKDIQDEMNCWTQCSLVLKSSCNLLFSTNRGLITEVLLAVFTKTYCPESDQNFHLFMQMFYNQEGSEFIRSASHLFKTSKETLKNQDILFKFLLEFSKYEIDEIILLEIWSLLMSQIKDLSSSGFKFKSIIWLLIENVCKLLGKIESFDSARITKDFDWIMKLIDYSVIYASKLNESSQWITKSDEIVDICSGRFSFLIMENVKDKNVGKCINSICQTLMPNIQNYFHDNEKINLVMSPIVVNLVTPNFKSPLRYSLMGQICSYCFDITLKYNLTSNKTWKRDLWEAFFDNAFLWMPRYYFSVLTGAFKILLTQESERFSEVLGKFSTSATASMFLSKDAEVLSKALNIRRLSFLTFWGNFDVFRIHLPSLQEKLVELTKYYNGFILGEIFFLIRVFLLRLSDESISSLWPLIMTELVQLFENSIKSEQISQSDLYAIFQACKLIDMMLTLRTSSILLYHWLFFDSAGKEGLFLRLEQKLKQGNNIENAKIYQTNDGKRRPLLSLSSAKDPTELLNFLETARSHLSHDYIMIQNLDLDFIDFMTENDLLEVLEIK